ncbi:MAG: isoprenyl transferase [Deltaproteobacteria bacterium]|jgi:undecaprenyl diphosphate synthase|nr:isoprenyl transferase [Deltaproteobacteria bacterium]
MENTPKIPQHIAIIMDGNGRWAEAKGLNRTEGHKAGAKPVRDILKACHKLKVKYLTLYTFSTENWFRPQDEIKSLFSLLIQYLDSETAELMRQGVRLMAIGDLERLPPESLSALKETMKETSSNSSITLSLALSYGSRAEIVYAAKKLMEKVAKGVLDPSSLSQELFASHLWSSPLPDVDLLIRTGGDKRISNFLLWQLAYAELYFTDILWPDFGPRDLEIAINDFQSRKRRFGRA